MEKEKPIFLSVVLPTYNDEKFILESVHSVLNQTYPYFELIVVNDGSTDQTLSLLKTIKDGRLVLIDKKNTGLIDSLNVGISKAKYDWIARMDGDDVSELNRFEEEVKYIRENVAIISSQCSVIDTEGNIIGHTKFFTSPIGIAISKRLTLPVIAHPTVLFNKSIYERAGRYDKLMYVAEDIDLWYKMLSMGRLELLNKRLLKLRKHGNNISNLKSEYQNLNSMVAYVKWMNGVNTTLSKAVYEKLCLAISQSKFLKFYDKMHGKGIFLYLLSEVLKYFYVLTNRTFRKCLKM